MATKSKVIKTLTTKGYKFNGKEFERIVGSKVYTIKVEDDRGEVFIWDSKDNRVTSATFHLS